MMLHCALTIHHCALVCSPPWDQNASEDLRCEQFSSLPRGGEACSTFREPFSAGIEASNASIDAGLDPGADVARPIH